MIIMNGLALGRVFGATRPAIQCASHVRAHHPHSHITLYALAA